MTTPTRDSNIGKFPLPNLKEEPPDHHDQTSGNINTNVNELQKNDACKDKKRG